MPRLGGLELCRQLRGEGRPDSILDADCQERRSGPHCRTGSRCRRTSPSLSLLRNSWRVSAHFCGGQPQQNLPDSLHFGDVEVDFPSVRGSEKRKNRGNDSKEFAILRFLASHAGEAVTRDELLNEVWATSRIPSVAPSTIIWPCFGPSSRSIRRSRRISNRSRVGYCFVGDENS